MRIDHNPGGGGNSQALPKNYAPKPQSLSEIKNWIAEINPNYNNPFIPNWSAFHYNCGSCAWAVEQRLRGENESAVASHINIGSDHEMETVTGKKCIYMSINDIESHLRAGGPGSHLIVGINRFPTPNGLPQCGHWFNAFFDGNRFYTIDGQSGQVLDWPYDYGDVSEWCALI